MRCVRSTKERALAVVQVGDASPRGWGGNRRPSGEGGGLDKGGGGVVSGATGASLTVWPIF